MRGITLDIVGMRFGKLVVISREGSDKKYRSTWLCLCDCGNTCIKSSAALMNKKSNISCGCLSKSKGHIYPPHGLSKHPLYTIWVNMRSRVLYPSFNMYKYYGGKGVKICTEWDNFKNFYDWAISNNWAQGLELDRIDSDGDYCPENCRFVSKIENINNRTNTRYLTYNNETKPLTEWCRLYNIPPGTLRARIFRYGWSIERALNEPVH